MARSRKIHRYKLKIEFETTEPVKQRDAKWIQFENALEVFVHGKNSIKDTLVYAKGKVKLKKVRE